MGVTGLASLIERLTKDARRAPTDLGKLAQEYAKLGNKVTLLVDGLSVLMKIICPPTLADQLLPSYATIDSVVSKFVLAFAQHNINLVFYFDSTSGTQDELHKQLESIKRREQDIDNLIDLEEYINNMDGDKPKNLIYPFLFRWQCTRVLERLGVRTVYCVGEADFALSSDGCKDYVYGILAYDSDFYICKGIRYIPISNLQFADNTISCQTYTIEDTAALLGVPSSSFVDMAILSGNDYTRNLACWHEMKTKHMSTENTINSALTAIKTNNALLTTYKNLVANNAEMKQVYALSCTLYGFSFSVSETNDASGDDFFEMLQMGVQLGKLPYSTLSIAKNGLLTTAVLPESLSGSTATDVVRSLIGAIFVLLGRNDGTLLLDYMYRPWRVRQHWALRL